MPPAGDLIVRIALILRPALYGTAVDEDQR